MVAVDNECRRFNARSYRVNKEDEGMFGSNHPAEANDLVLTLMTDCVLVTFSDRQCQNRLTRREFDRKDRENDDDDEDEDEACERLPQRARSYRVRCSNDDEDNDNEDEEDD